ncbi:hydroxysteroid dehydrogenase-like protein 2 [Varroa jacobsoni]|uniref:hydroxysteroid dehydrogenase-like protein 2 n=1 Tax=Varroa jacobsoni TaxID=62625 RepID=UPI000BF4A797|nr:hydroxysteroid dehydrogenase-like protein 2 [Varroa jacobsoni]XP_022699012.1 hydroxysteroid dehydrogenase-like protein 2 [Varroa jacobsoni]XP_022699014.1 hydroxysteroid dehydrogenase-like protein 2 [Varroa jacobsoni]XP_022699015.1 hydroxysteroid dehydrogenase-like protein 2 [Varroa jacobsoni]XP_022699016.1 hydroxysteroid dehydrogenase-like protein 2 [Varroa jacobsoni]
MLNNGKLAGKTILITGASRGIGKEIALKCAKDKANIVVAAKTATANPKLPGTIYTAAEEIEKAGGKAHAVVMDIRDEANIRNAIEEGAKKFGGIDILINNASAISLTPTESTEIKKYDLMHHVNVRGTFITSKMCIPYLRKSAGGGRILNNSPPLVMSAKWFAPHVAYTMTKFGMSMCALGMAEEFKGQNIAVNTLWPKTAIYTAATAMLAGSADAAMSNSRSPAIMADAAYAILTKPLSFTGNFCIDEEVLRAEGITDFDQYACKKGSEIMLDFFLPDKYYENGKLLPTANGTPTEAAAAAAAPEVKPLDGVFESIKRLLSVDLVEKIKGVFLFEVKEGGEYFIDLKSGAGAAGKGAPTNKVDVTFVSNEQTFLQMFEGSLKPTAAFMSGKLKLKGDMSKAMKLEKLFKETKGKL